MVTTCFLSYQVSTLVVKCMVMSVLQMDMKTLKNNSLVQSPTGLEREAKSQVPFHCPGIRLIFSLAAI